MELGFDCRVNTLLIHTISIKRFGRVYLLIMMMQVIIMVQELKKNMSNELFVC